MKNLIAFVLFILPQFSFGQNGSFAYERLKGAINENLKLCEAYGMRNYEALGELDIDSISDRAARDIVKLLCLEESRNLKLDEFNGIALTASTNDQTRIRIYTFSYASGGTMGPVIYNILQWTNLDGKLFAYNLPWYEYGFFNSTIVTLKVDSAASLYLLTGAIKECTMHIGYWATVFRFSGDFFYTNYNAFGNRNQLSLTNTSMTYDTTTKILHLSPWNFDEFKSNMDWTYNFDNTDDASRYKNDTAGNRRYYDLVLGKYNANPNYPTDHGINLQWNGTRFINIGPADKPDQE